MSNLSILYAFLGGAIVGAGAAVLFAPEKGEDTRRKIRNSFRKKASSALTTKSTRLLNSSQLRLTSKRLAFDITKYNAYHAADATTGICRAVVF